MRVWLLSVVPPVSADTAYLVGRVLSRAVGIEVSLVRAEDSACPAPPEGVDIVFNRSFNTNREFLAGLDGLSRSLRIPIVNPGSATYAACDKRTYIEDYPDRIPSTCVVNSSDGLAAAFREMGGAVVVKDPFGKRGIGVERLITARDLTRGEQLLGTVGCGELVVQSYCEGFEQGDKRVLLQRAGNNEYEITGCYRRIPAPGGWKSNVCAGGRASPAVLSEVERRFCLETAALTNLVYVGLDIGWHQGRLFLIETNAYAGGQVDFDTLGNGTSGDSLAQLLSAMVGTLSQRPH